MVLPTHSIQVKNRLLSLDSLLHETGRDSAIRSTRHHSYFCALVGFISNSCTLLCEDELCSTCEQLPRTAALPLPECTDHHHTCRSGQSARQSLHASCRSRTCWSNRRKHGRHFADRTLILCSDSGPPTASDDLDDLSDELARVHFASHCSSPPVRDRKRVRPKKGLSRCR
jgi:hypothetical protein